MARIVFAALFLACIAGSALAGPCMYVDGDCKPSPKALPGTPKGAASNWVRLLRGFEGCKGKMGAACSGPCTMMAGKGCTLTPAVRKAFLGTLGPSFAACTKITTPAACRANPNCAVGAGNTCVIAATGITNVFSLTTNFPSAIPVLRNCKTMVASPAKCDM